MDPRERSCSQLRECQSPQITAAWGPLAPQRRRPVISTVRAECPSALTGLLSSGENITCMLMDGPESSRLNHRAFTKTWLTAPNTSSSYAESWDLLPQAALTHVLANTHAHTISQFVLWRLLLKWLMLPNNKNNWCCCGGWAHHKVFSMCCPLEWQHGFTPRFCSTDGSVINPYFSWNHPGYLRVVPHSEQRLFSFVTF